MQELTNFYNKGYGWICRQCEAEPGSSRKESERSRLMSEGEAESKQPEMSTNALAKWDDLSRTALRCPRCGIAELVKEI